MTPATGEHYFSPSPSGDFEVRDINVRLAGRDVVVATAGGVFSPDHVDDGTQALLRLVPEAPVSGDLLDLGCGWGPIALSLALESPGATIWAVDVNQRALDLTRRNSQRLGCENIHACEPQDVPDEVVFDTIWSNPPIRVGKAELHEILETWVPRLKQGATAYFVVAKHLGADSLIAWLTERFRNSHEVTKGDHYKGFRVIEVRKT